jgi:hypothetical protein
MPTNKGEAYTGDARLAKSSCYLRAYHLQGRDVPVQIEHAQREMVKSTDGTEKKMLVIYFAGKSLGLGLNNTNIDMVVSLHGKAVKGWIGKRITLFPTTCMAFGKRTDCIRIREKAPQANDVHCEPDPEMAEGGAA